MQSSSLCDLFLTLVLQQETKQVLGCTGKSGAARPREGIPLPTHPAFPDHVCSTVSAFGLPSTRLTVTSCSNSTWWTKRDQDNQAGSALREGSKLEKSYWNLQVPICNMQRRQSWVLLRGKEQMQLHGKFFLCCWEVFTLCGESGFSKERYRTTTRWNPRSPNPGKRFSFTLHFDIHLHTSTHQWHQTNTPLLTQMKSSNTNRTSPAGREKCSTPRCKEFRSDAWIQVPSLLCSIVGISLLKKDTKKVEINSEWQF